MGTMRPTSSDCHFLLFGIAVARRFRGIVQDLELRLQDLEAMAAAIAGFDFAVQRDQHAGAKLVLQIGRVEPDALQRVAALADGHLEEGHAAGAEEAEGAHLGDDAGHLARPQLADAARIQAIFVAEGQIVEQVLDRADALLQQDLGEPRADAFDVLHVGGEIEHRVMVNEEQRMLLAARYSLFALARRADILHG